MNQAPLLAVPPARQGRSAGDDPVPDTIEDVLRRARERIARWSPQEALGRHRRGARFVDIRPYHQRLDEGEIPGALIIERNVLEWRLDPPSPDRIPHARSHRSEFIVVCSEGYTSSLAAASLLDIGLARSGDLIGGVRGWIGQGLPHRVGGTPAGERVPGNLDWLWGRTGPH
jgi:rhodanese-related sulfurtransferase